MKMTERDAHLAPDFLNGAVDLLMKKTGIKKNRRKGNACKLLKRWCARPDSNGRPADSKTLFKHLASIFLRMQEVAIVDITVCC